MQLDDRAALLADSRVKPDTLYHFLGSIGISDRTRLDRSGCRHEGAHDWCCTDMDMRGNSRHNNSETFAAVQKANNIIDYKEALLPIYNRNL